MNIEAVAILVLALVIIAWFIPQARPYVLFTAATWLLTGRKPTANVAPRKDTFTEKLDRESVNHQTEQRGIDDAASPAPDSDPVSDDVERLRARLDKHRRAVADRDADDLGISNRD